MNNLRMQEAMEQLLSISMGMEALYSFVIILCSLMVYFGTKEIYDLTNHKGIKYFRLSFLFFAIAYFFRSFIKLLVIVFGAKAIRDIPQFFAPLTLFIFIYASSMAIFYLFYSMVSKKLENKSYLFHIFAVSVSAVIVLFSNSWIYLGVNILLFILLTSGIYLMHSNKKEHRKNRFFIIYILLFAFWILNILDILLPTIIGRYQFTVYLLSIGIFMLILFKVLKRAG